LELITGGIIESNTAVCARSDPRVLSRGNGRQWLVCIIDSSRFRVLSIADCPNTRHTVSTTSIERPVNVMVSLDASITRQMITAYVPSGENAIAVAPAL
jgi:hypothetical protein